MKLYHISYKHHTLYVSGYPEDHDEIMALTRYGVEVREATEQDEHNLRAEEAEQDINDPDISLTWMEDEGIIVLTVKDWE